MQIFILLWKEHDSLYNKAFNTFSEMQQEVIHRFDLAGFTYCKFIDKEKHILFYEKIDN